MKTKHTPGPWYEDTENHVQLNDQLEILRESKDWVSVVIKEENEVAGVVALCHPDNAELIASAPDLLKENEELKQLNQELLRFVNVVSEFNPDGNPQRLIERAIELYERHTKTESK